MPNWVFNKLLIVNRDPSEDGAAVQRLVDQVGAEYSRKMLVRTKDEVSGRFTMELESETTQEPFSFWNIVRPEGEDLVRYEESHISGGAMPYWYDWNCDKWGTKWDAGNPCLLSKSHGVSYSFDTAWSPPLPVLVELSNQHPDLLITLDWEEEQGYGGTFEFLNGEVTETDAYDIPSSHLEMTERGKDCYCEVNGEAVFTDCPNNRSESKDFPDNELEVEVMT